MHKRKQYRDYRGKEREVKEILFDPKLMNVLFPSPARKSYLPEEERTYVEGRDWTIATPTFTRR